MSRMGQCPFAPGQQQKPCGLLQERIAIRLKHFSLVMRGLDPRIHADRLEIGAAYVWCGAASMCASIGAEISAPPAIPAAPVKPAM